MAKFCSNRCANESGRRRFREVAGSRSDLPTGTVGALSELLVCTNLLERGFSVFRSVSPSCPCDLIAMKDSKTIRVEVKTAYMSLGGKLMAPKHDRWKYDTIAYAVRGHGIVYNPPLEELAP